MRCLENNLATQLTSGTATDGLAKASAFLKNGDALVAQKCFTQAVLSYEAALEIRTQAVGEGSLKVANVKHCIGVALLKSSLPEHLTEQLSGEGSRSTAAEDTTNNEQQATLCQAVRFLERSLNVRRRKLGANHIDVAESEHYLGVALSHVSGDRMKEALQLLHNAFRMRCTILGGQNNSVVAESLRGLGVAYQKSGNQRRAIQAFAFALSVHESVHGEASSEVAVDLLALSRVYTTSGDHDMALSHSTKALAILKTRFGLDDHRTADGWLRLGLCHYARGDLRSAVKATLPAIRILSSSDLSPGVRAARLCEAWTILAEARWEMQEYELAVIAAQVVADGVVGQGANTTPGEDREGWIQMSSDRQMANSIRDSSSMERMDLLTTRLVSFLDNVGNTRGPNNIRNREEWHRYLIHRGNSTNGYHLVHLTRMTSYEPPLCYCFDPLRYQIQPEATQQSRSGSKYFFKEKALVLKGCQGSGKATLFKVLTGDVGLVSAQAVTREASYSSGQGSALDLRIVVTPGISGDFNECLQIRKGFTDSGEVSQICLVACLGMSSAVTMPSGCCGARDMMGGIHPPSLHGLKAACTVGTEIELGFEPAGNVKACLKAKLELREGESKTAALSETFCYSASRRLNDLLSFLLRLLGNARLAQNRDSGWAQRCDFRECGVGPRGNFLDDRAAAIFCF